MLTPADRSTIAADEPDAPLELPRHLDVSVQKRVNARDEAAAAADWLLARRGAGDAWRDMLVVAPGKRNWRDPIALALDRNAIPHRMLLGDPTREIDRIGEHVHVTTFHAARGLVFTDVAVLGIGDLPWKSQTVDEVAGLLRAVMACATNSLLILHSKPSALADLLSSASCSHARGAGRRPTSPGSDGRTHD